MNNDNMKILRQVKMCLLGVAGVNLLSVGATALIAVRASSILLQADVDPYVRSLVGVPSLLDFIPIYSIFLAGIAYMGYKEFKQDSATTYFTSLTVFILSMNSWAFPVAAFGIYLLAQKPIREIYLKNLLSELKGE